MNYYVLLPMFGMLANVILGTYVISLNPRDRLNRIFAYVSASLALWSFCDILFFISKDPQTATKWDRLTAFGATFAVSILLHFFIVFTKVKITLFKTCLILYIPAMLLIGLIISTDLVIKSAVPADWGYAIIFGPLYPLDIFVLSLYTLISIFLGIKFYFKTKDPREKNQCRLLVLAISLPLVFGVLTELVPTFFDRKIIPLTSTFSTITAIVVAYAIIKYQLMAITPAMANENIIETMADYLIVINKDKKVVQTSKSLQEVNTTSKMTWVNRHLYSLPIKIDGLFEELEKYSPVRDFNAEITDTNNKVMPISINASTMKDNKGNLLGYVLLMRDVSESKKLIADLEANTKKTEETNKELYQMNKLMVGRELKMVELKKRIKELENNKHLIT